MNNAAAHTPPWLIGPAAPVIRLMSGETTGKTLVRLDETVSTLADWKAPARG